MELQGRSLHAVASSSKLKFLVEKKLGKKKKGDKGSTQGKDHVT